MNCKHSVLYYAPINVFPLRGGERCGQPRGILKFCVKIPTVGQGTAVKIPHYIPKITRHTYVFQCEHTVYTGLNLVKIETLCIKGYKIPFSMKLDRLALVSICEIDVTSFSEDGRGVK